MTMFQSAVDYQVGSAVQWSGKFQLNGWALKTEFSMNNPFLLRACTSAISF